MEGAKEDSPLRSIHPPASRGRGPLPSERPGGDTPSPGGLELEMLGKPTQFQRSHSSLIYAIDVVCFWIVATVLVSALVAGVIALHR